MAERSQYQYTALVGPVWSEPVASRLAWLPSGVWQPTRTLPPNRLGDFTQPAFDALYKPAGVQWIPADLYIGRAFPLGRLGNFAFVQLVAAPAFDPQNLEWQPRGVAPQIPVEFRRVGDFQQPVFPALYDPRRLEWVPADRYFGRAVQKVPNDFSVSPPFAVVPAPPPEVVPPRPGGDSARRLLRRRPLHYWEAAALKRLKREEVETSLVEELAYAEATIPKSLDDFEERVSHLRGIAERLDSIRVYHELAKRVRSVIERFEETRIKQLAEQDEENEINDLIQFL